MTLKEKMQNGELYDCDFAALDEELDKKLWECKDLLHDFNHLRPSQLAEKEAIIKKVFASVKGSFYIEQPFHANWGCNVTIGDNFYANFNLTLVDDAPITFGDNVMVAPNVTISTGTHPILPELRVKTYQYNLPVTIKDGVWILSLIHISFGRISAHSSCRKRSLHSRWSPWAYCNNRELRNLRPGHRS